MSAEAEGPHGPRSTATVVPLTPPAQGVYLFVAIALGAYLAFLVYLYSQQTQAATPELQQEHFRGMVITAVISILTAAPIIWAVGRRSLVVTDRELQMRAGFYQKTIPLEHVRIDSAQQVSLFQRAEYAPRWRTNGIRLPGYRVGWFRLRTGDKALLYLTDPFQVTIVPTTLGFLLLLSTDALLPVLRDRMQARAVDSTSPATPTPGDATQ